ncbi:HAD-IA family hydrolase [Streptomyces sp. NPDC049954]|uniref:HAD-IA family hydrolase n=1 Tax=Streptomyces sp. NPDC049954 TaxID=3155779 RepID=UPI00341C5A99
MGTHPWNLYDGYDVRRRYDAVVLSEEVGLRKPDPRIFRLMFEALDLPAQECVFVDDTEPYLAPAAELGSAVHHAREPAETVAVLEGMLGVPLSAADA